MKLNLVGQRFGRLTVISKSKHEDIKHSYWLCSCDCGNETVVRGDRLRTESDLKARSCGCLQREFTAGLAKKVLTTHGLRHTPEYNLWSRIINRTENPKAHDAWIWQSKNIRIYSEWRHDVAKFVAYIRSIGFQPGLHCHRIDNDKDYEPGNIVFITGEEHALIHRLGHHRR